MLRIASALVVGVGILGVVLGGDPWAHVTLHVFSGRPDPSWALNTTEAAQVLELLSKEAPVGVGPPPPSLGYRGFTLNVMGWRDPISVWNSPMLEAFLLSTADTDACPIAAELLNGHSF